MKNRRQDSDGWRRIPADVTLIVATMTHSVQIGLWLSNHSGSLVLCLDEPVNLCKVDEIIRLAGFELKPSKTRYAGSGGRKEVTGLISGKFVQPPLEWRKLNRARLHRLTKKVTLDKKDVAYLLGLRGYAMQFPDAVQMQALLKGADSLLAKTRGD